MRDTPSSSTSKVSNLSTLSSGPSSSTSTRDTSPASIKSSKANANAGSNSARGFKPDNPGHSSSPANASTAIPSSLTTTGTGTSTSPTTSSPATSVAATGSETQTSATLEISTSNANHSSITTSPNTNLNLEPQIQTSMPPTTTALPAMDRGRTSTPSETAFTSTSAPSSSTATTTDNQSRRGLPNLSIDTTATSTSSTTNNPRGNMQSHTQTGSGSASLGGVPATTSATVAAGTHPHALPSRSMTSTNWRQDAMTKQVQAQAQVQQVQQTQQVQTQQVQPHPAHAQQPQQVQVPGQAQQAQAQASYGHGHNNSNGSAANDIFTYTMAGGVSGGNSAGPGHSSASSSLVGSTYGMRDFNKSAGDFSSHTGNFSNGDCNARDFKNGANGQGHASNGSNGPVHGPGNGHGNNGSGPNSNYNAPVNMHYTNPTGSNNTRAADFSALISALNNLNLSELTGYCFDRGNGRFTRLVPVDSLPPLKEISAVESGCDGMVVLPVPESAYGGQLGLVNHPQHPQTPASGSGNGDIQSRIDTIISTQPSPTSYHHNSSTLHTSLNHPSTPSHGHSSHGPPPGRRPKIYCDKWVHEGVCAFTQQGCKYKHEMPTDKATQHQLGLFHGLPPWWKKHQAEISRFSVEIVPAGGGDARDNGGLGGGGGTPTGTRGPSALAHLLAASEPGMVAPVSAAAPAGLPTVQNQYHSDRQDAVQQQQQQGQHQQQQQGQHQQQQQGQHQQQQQGQQQPITFFPPRQPLRTPMSCLGNSFPTTSTSSSSEASLGSASGGGVESNASAASSFASGREKGFGPGPGPSMPIRQGGNMATAGVGAGYTRPHGDELGGGSVAVAGQRGWRRSTPTPIQTDLSSGNMSVGPGTPMTTSAEMGMMRSGGLANSRHAQGNGGGGGVVRGPPGFTTSISPFGPIAPPARTIPSTPTQGQSSTSISGHGMPAQTPIGTERAYPRYLPQSQNPFLPLQDNDGGNMNTAPKVGALPQNVVDVTTKNGGTAPTNGVSGTSTTTGTSASGNDSGTAGDGREPGGGVSLSYVAKTYAQGRGKKQSEGKQGEKEGVVRQRWKGKKGGAGEGGKKKPTAATVGDDAVTAVA